MNSARRVSLGLAAALLLTGCGSSGPGFRVVAAPPEVGSRAPDFQLPSVAHGVVRLSDYAGRRHVLVLFYTSGT